MMPNKDAMALVKSPHLIDALRAEVRDAERKVADMGIDPSLSEEEQGAVVRQQNMSNQAHRDAWSHIRHLSSKRFALNAIEWYLAGERPDLLGNPMKVGSTVVWPAPSGNSGSMLRQGTVVGLNPNGGIKIKPSTPRWRWYGATDDPTAVTVTTNAQYVTVIDPLLRNTNPGGSNP